MVFVCGEGKCAHGRGFLLTGSDANRWVHNCKMSYKFGAGRHTQWMWTIGLWNGAGASIDSILHFKNTHSVGDVRLKGAAVCNGVKCRGNYTLESLPPLEMSA